jgi:hypothetical protein
MGFAPDDDWDKDTPSFVSELPDEDVPFVPAMFNPESGQQFSHIEDNARDLLARMDSVEPEKGVDPLQTSFEDEYLGTQRRAAAANIAQSIKHETVDDLLISAQKIEKYLATGEMPTGVPGEPD